MKLKILIAITLFATTIFATPLESSVLKNGVFVAEVKSFNNNGFLNCEFQCFLDVQNVDLKRQPRVIFQVGIEGSPVEYGLIVLDENFFKNNATEKVLTEEGYKLKISLGNIPVKEGYTAKIVTYDKGIENVTNLTATDFNDSMTIMDIDVEAERRGLCKAELFLMKIDFDNLYEYSELIK